MKKTFLMLLAGIVLAGFTFTACSDDDDDVVVNTGDGGTGAGDEGGGSGDEGGGAGDEGGGTTTTLHESLQGSDYYVLVMDDYTIEEISDKVTLDLRAGWQDEDGYHGDELWIWDGTYEGGVCSGLNFYGEIADWCSLVVTSVGWSGLGYCLYLDEDQYAKMAIDDNYYLHLAYKTSQSGKSHEVYVCGPEGAQGTPFAIGDVDYVDGDVTYTPVTPESGAFEVGEWNEYNIPVSSFGLDWTLAWGKKTNEETGEEEVDNENILCVLSGGVQGTTLDLDAVFFYKKAE